MPESLLYCFSAVLHLFSPLEMISQCFYKLAPPYFYYQSLHVYKFNTGSRIIPFVSHIQAAFGLQKKLLPLLSLNSHHIDF